MGVDEEPLRAQLFTAEEMEQHGRHLAAEHELTHRHGRDRLLRRLGDNERALADTCALLAQSAERQRRVTPAGEWLLDNFYLIEEEVRTAKRHMPPGYSRELPRIASGESAGLPRVYDLALHAVAHGDSRLGRGSLTRFIASYQAVKTLRLGELWAVPIMLRLALIENLRRVAARVATSMAERDLAGLWADRMIDIAERDPKSLILVVADMARSGPAMTAPFVAELSRRLHGRSTALALPLTWVEQHLGEGHQTIEELVKFEAQAQAAAQVSVSNSIGSLRLLASMDWREFVETLSTVEQALRHDPADVYPRMDFATRDSYRHAVERIARHVDASEADVASAAVQLAREAAAGPEPAAHRAHVGYYLVDAGQAQLEHAVAMRAPLAHRVHRTVARRPLAWFAGAILATTLLLALLPLAIVTHGFATPLAALPVGAWVAVVAVAALLISASQLAVAILNWFAPLLTRPRALPRMDFSFGIPNASRTLVVVPTMLSSVQAIDALAEALEVRFLANRDTHLHFALLTDFLDAPTQTLPLDEALLAHARECIEALNRRYAEAGERPRGGDRFFLFHRPRRWNAADRIWMGHERKRGKLGDLNALLRGAGQERFSLVVGDTAALPGVRYVITLDTDTQLPRDAARKFVATMAHPLNRPRLGGRPEAPRVLGGHGILQPRVGVSLAAANRTRYGRLFGGDAGIDPYTRAVSDVYQDLFGEGSFIGKGIYDVDAFEQVLGDRLPDNRVLSHDLLEGGYARSGLISDIELVEESPARYDFDVKRRHRWMRGDWQIAAWILPRVPIALETPGGERTRSARGPNPLSALSRMKILDNLRRSLVPGALTVLLLLGWAVLAQPVAWTLAALAVFFVPALLGLAGDLMRKPDALAWRTHLLGVVSAAERQAAQALVALAVLPYEARFSLDAIFRTLWRLHVSHCGLLEWQTSAEASVRRPATVVGDLAATYRRMAVAPAMALIAFAGLSVERPQALVAALPVLLLWAGAPAIIWWLNQPLARRQSTISDAQALQLRLLARRTWAFFETFVGPADHHLPPDNVQEHPVARVAHRTSPTNIGLSLLATLTARDFGYLTTTELIERTAATLDAMGRMERHRGHWFNWYDTQTLQPLRPAYVSSVDSGNLAGHLLTLRAGLKGLADAHPHNDLLFGGLDDTLRLLQQAMRSDDDAMPVERFAALLADTRAATLRSPDELRAAWQALSQHADDLLAALPRPVPATDVPLDVPLDVPPDVPLAQAEAQRWAHALRRQCEAAAAEASALWSPPAGTSPGQWNESALAAQRERLLQLSERIGSMAEMDFGFLYDPARDLLAIGYNVDDRRLDAGHYDLLASEVRLASFVAIATGKIPQASWFALGRQLATLDRKTVLLSWSGSMFEYLMPMLVMPSYENTLLDETMRGAVERQVRYGRQRSVPWGISESGYNATDAQLNYQYRAFGVPGLGLKRGLAADLVVAPYATMMALMVDPNAAVLNLKRLADEGLAGTFGYHEAIDYTPSRLPRGEKSAVVRSYMAHHQGMGLLALAYLLLDRPMQRRFESDPALQATLLLLQERVPRAVPFHPEMAERVDFRSGQPSTETPLRVIATPDTASPEVQLLSNGRYHVMLTNSGAGYSRWKDVAVTRWREDGTTDAWGSYCYLRDTETGTVWSTTPQPTQRRPDKFEAVFSEGRAEFRRRDQGIDAYTEVVVSPEDDIELRRLRLTNRSRSRRTIELTTYAEIVIAPAAADAAHPAFSKLFVQTELLEQPPLILATRRPRSAEERSPWMFHLVAVHGAAGGPVSHETDRARFIGRGRGLHAPAAMRDAAPLSGTAGSVLDPVAATRRVITLEPEQTALVDIVYGAADSRETCLALAHKMMDRRLADRVFELAWTHSQVILRQLNASEADAQTYARLANTVVYSQPTLRADAGVLLRNRRGQSGLWGYAISGDLPIVLLQISDAASIDLVRQMVQAHAWWRLKGLVVDLVIWNEERDVYRQRLQEQILGLISSSIESHVIDRPGGIFVRHAEHIAGEDRVLLQAVARATVSDRLGTLAQQVAAKRMAERRPPTLKTTHPPEPGVATPPPEDTRALMLFNGFGGFTPDGREYVISTDGVRRPPAPWVNVIANPRFGTVVSEAGSAYTWCENAHELRLTPWHNDPVSDTGGEAIFLRDEDSGQIWSPTSRPASGGPRDADDEEAGSPYRVRHGFGYSVFEHDEAAVHSELTVFVALDDAVKFSRLVLRNDSPRRRRLSATGYVEWVLGDLAEKNAPHVHTEIASDNGALYARNRYSNDFGDWIAFFDVDPADRITGSVTADRDEFVGRNGSLQRPAAMLRAGLSGRTGAALDPCGAIQAVIELAPGQSREIVFRLGMGRSADEAGKLVQRHRGSAAARATLAAVHAHWRHALGAVQVRTPEPTLDLLANGWLMYQTIACRMWARSGYYQSGGAYGFRDQLQDAMALVHTRPRLLREHLLVCAGRQFPEGDVQHWWHPPAGRGVRTHISDDYLWLPLALARYVQATNDTGVLGEEAGFLDGPAVAAHDESWYDMPGRATETASLYEHARRSVQHGLRYGAHGLPLMGAGDWNDGMNRVGSQGRGESVWLGFFLCEVLREFAPLARRWSDEAFAQRCDDERVGLARRLEQTGWDGSWYRRAYFDDGTPLGSTDSAECRIDAIAQSWAVLSGVGSEERARRAMDAVAAHLVRDEAGLVRLLDPPFDRRGPNPGYIAGYVPGVRENGGQYTHSAVWAAMAFAALGDAAHAWQVMNLINPLHHGRSADSVAVYKVEPYVVAADVYSVAPHVGRGGWTWYTGSAGWMYRLVVESLLGLTLRVDDDGARLLIRPCLPVEWTGYHVDYRFRETTYRIDIDSAGGAAPSVTVDGELQPGGGIPLVDDGREHAVRVGL
ncbi:MAG: cyclic beta 1-2 glucan synthetase [Burkholderiaceae bacterium]|nr:cyclic beta 1-2 glucan synthetase [Burkholderiaceae bacterium]